VIAAQREAAPRLVAAAPPTIECLARLHAQRTLDDTEFAAARRNGSAGSQPD
jgi:hypothetical protein